MFMGVNGISCVQLVPMESRRGGWVTWDWSETVISHYVGAGTRTWDPWKSSSYSSTTESSHQLPSLFKNKGHDNILMLKKSKYAWEINDL